MDLTIKQNPNPMLSVSCSSDCYYYNGFEATCDFPGNKKKPNDDNCVPFAKWFASANKYIEFKKEYF